jgi:hypothetical protein
VEQVKFGERHSEAGFEPVLHGGVDEVEDVRKVQDPRRVAMGETDLPLVEEGHA